MHDTKPQSSRKPRKRKATRLSQRLGLTLLAFGVAVVPTLPAALAAESVTVTITDRLDPATMTIAPGTTVTWRNDDSERHRMRTQSGPEDFDSGSLDPGQAFTFTFQTSGTYSYLDDRNDDNSAYFGTITVSTEAPPPDPGDGSGGTTPGSTTVTVIDRSYRPASISVAAGSTVTWSNVDDRPHTTTARDGSFDSGIYDTGGGYSKTFDTPGTFNYFCTLHPDMTGTVAVTGADGTAPPPDPIEEPPTEPTPPPPPPSGPGSVSIFDNGYTPTSLTIAEGSTITWTNTGVVPHTATDRAGSFDSGILMGGDTYNKTFSTAGTFNYFCTIHPDMTATITVTGTDGTAPPPAPADETVVTSPPTSATPPRPSGPGSVTIFDNGYTPKSITVSEGSTITWTNTGVVPHTATDRAGSFDSGILMGNESYRRTFNTTGTYNYFCTIHPDMTATVTVTGTDGTAPPPAETVAEGAAETTDSATDDGVTIVDNAFQPEPITVGVGTTVVWTNDGRNTHTVRAQDGEFGSSLLLAGSTFEHEFTSKGRFSYFCSLHPDMTGTVIVTDAASDSTAGNNGPAAVGIIDLDYDPRSLSIQPGTTVIWTNVGAIPHTVTAEGQFDSGILTTGQTYERTFATVGTYDYLCTLHPNMVGQITVEESAETSVGVVETDVDTGVGAAAEALATALQPSNDSANGSLIFAVLLAGGLVLGGIGVAVGAGKLSHAMD